jgi:hypothetical protein
MGEREKQIMKKNIILALATGMVATAMLAGCGSTTETASVEDDNDVTSEAAKTTSKADAEDEGESEDEVEVETEAIEENTVEPHEHVYDYEYACDYEGGDYYVHTNAEHDEEHNTEAIHCSYENCDEVFTIEIHDCEIINMGTINTDEYLYTLYYSIAEYGEEYYYHNIVRNNDATDDTDGTMTVSCWYDGCPVTATIPDHDWGEIKKPDVTELEDVNEYIWWRKCNKCGEVQDIEIPVDVIKEIYKEYGIHIYSF